MNPSNNKSDDERNCCNIDQQELQASSNDGRVSTTIPQICLRTSRYDASSSLVDSSFFVLSFSPAESASTLPMNTCAAEQQKELIMTLIEEALDIIGEEEGEPPIAKQ